MSLQSFEQTEDLKAFERRLTEVISYLQPVTLRWRLLLILVSVATATGAWSWIWDPETSNVSFISSLKNHPFFTLSCFILILLFVAGIHKRVVAPSIIASRCRQVLQDYNMSCDDVRPVGARSYLMHMRRTQRNYRYLDVEKTGKLILRPRPPPML